ncbi:MAG: MFS transporter [Bacteroidetes bacterium]|nr:MFS transporter [Bacteroidota bacterium]
MQNITRTIWLLSLVSLFTDMASEMLYPVMPVYLKSIGFSVLFIGVLEGLAEATAGLSKGYFGRLSDNSGKRVPFVQAGYGLSAIAKPMLALFVYPLWIFFSRTLDRLGKGIRTGARDAILSDEATSETKGKIFGFHRSLDTLGAVIGPLLAVLYLYFFPGHYKSLFLLAFFPGLIAVVATGLLHKKNKPAPTEKKHASFFSFLGYWKESPLRYRQLVIGLLVFALFNSSDVFLLLKGKQAGLADETVIWVYIGYNLVYAIFSFPLGIVADKIGLKTVFIIGLVLFALVYFGMSLSIHLYAYFALYSLYGIYSAATDGISKAWISNIADKKDTATAIGAYSGFQSICAMLASSLTGFIWFRFGQSLAFIATSIITVMTAVYFLLFIPGVRKK